MYIPCGETLTFDILLKKLNPDLNFEQKEIEL